MADAAFIEANAALHDFLVAEADALGWHWFIRADTRTFFIWAGGRLVTVTADEGPGDIAFEVFTSGGVCLMAESAAMAVDMVFGAMTAPEAGA